MLYKTFLQGLFGIVEAILGHAVPCSWVNTGFGFAAFSQFRPINLFSVGMKLVPQQCSALLGCLETNIFQSFVPLKNHTRQKAPQQWPFLTLCTALNKIKQFNLTLRTNYKQNKFPQWNIMNGSQRSDACAKNMYWTVVPLVQASFSCDSCSCNHAITGCRYPPLIIGGMWTRPRCICKVTCFPGIPLFHQWWKNNACKLIYIYIYCTVCKCFKFNGPWI